MGACRKLRLFLWKNFLLRKRQWCVSLFEILIPILAFVFIYPSWTKDKEEVTTPIELKWPDTFCNKTVPQCSDKATCNFIAYYPVNMKTQAVMEHVQKSICKNGDTMTVNLEPCTTPVNDELQDKFDKEWSKKPNFRGAVIFSDKLIQSLNAPSTSNSELSLPYKIRINGIYLRVDTSKIFPEKGSKDFRRIGPILENRKAYSDSGFIGLQFAIDKALAKELKGEDFQREVNLTSFPYPLYLNVKNRKLDIDIFIYLGLVMTMTMMIPSITRNVVGEKQSGISELLRLTGVSGWIQWLGWFIHGMTPHLITILLYTIMTTGLVFKSSSFSMLLIIFVLYVCSSITFVFFVCSLVQKPVIATSVALLAWIGSYLVGLLYTGLFRRKSFFFKMGLAVIPNWALSVLLANIDHLVVTANDEKDKGPGATWANIGSKVEMDGVDDDALVSNGEIITMLALSVPGYMLLTLYFGCVMPSEHGVKRPWYLINFGLGGKVAPATRTQSSTGFEEENTSAQVGVDIQNMSKRFGGKVAVKEVSLKMYLGDIFALLGHSGAGKTTLISMLTGFFAPSEGTAIINGYDIRTDPEKARQSMGLCPQHNMLFTSLTVAENLRLFGKLRGLTSAQAKAETAELVEMMNFAEKSKVRASNLSGGQKRKVCLGMALIGGTKVVVLDEPTNAMDPQARRQIWDLMLQLRGERTILLTTHFMEEADVLGDRIGIMAAGVLQCCGTTAFLKKVYGSGYTLKLTMNDNLDGVVTKKKSLVLEDNDEDADGAEIEKKKKKRSITKVGSASSGAEAILTTVQKHVSDATFKTDSVTSGARNEVSLTLPTHTATTAALRNMFADLTAKKEALGIKAMGLSQTTMDEVFLRVGQLAEGDDHEDEEIDVDGFQKAPRDLEHLSKHQYKALVKKKFIWARRSLVITLFAILIPVLFSLLAMSVLNSFTNPKNNADAKVVINLKVTSSEELTIDFSKYTEPVTLHSGEKTLLPLITSLDDITPKEVDDVEKELIKVGEKDISNYKLKHIIATKIDDKEFKAMFNLFPYHAAPLAINVASNTLLRALDTNKKYLIKVTNHPFSLGSPSSRSAILASGNSRSLARSANTPERECKDLPRPKASEASMILASAVVGCVWTLGFVVFVSTFIINPVEERLSNVKQLITMTGVHPALYWGSMFTWDVLLYSFVTLLILIIVFAVDGGLGQATISGGMGAYILIVIFLIHGISGISFTYWFSFYACSISTGFSIVMIIFIVTGIVAPVVIIPMEFTEKDNGIWVLVSFLLHISPTYALTRALMLLIFIAGSKNMCQISYADDEDVKLCLDKNCSPSSRSYFEWTMQFNKSSFPGLGQHMFMMIFVAAVYIFVVLRKEMKLCGCKSKGSSSNFPPNINDDDVLAEKERVDELVASGETDKECMVVQDLCKSYFTFAAVSHLNFGVHQGECFGLLGVNGAGKTTAFRMITGDESISCGNAYGFGTSLKKNPRKFFSNIGYCPQFDAILPKLTGKEMLQLFAGLRGVPSSATASEAMNWLSRMGLLGSANVKCGKYSGGMKRRLCTAMATIGDPSLILLDEPTSGVDPVARRNFWKILNKMKETGQSIILTSHSMEECEALCSRMGIMVNGQFQCFGSVQHLKNKFAQGYTLSIKLKPDLSFQTEEMQAKISELEEKILMRFKPCELKDKHTNMLQFHLQDASMSWNVLFKATEDTKEEFGHLIEDYSVNETSLEEVFLSFAKGQYGERRTSGGCCRQCFCCCC